MRKKFIFSLSLVLAIAMLLSVISFAFESVPVKSLELNKKELTITVGQSFSLSAAISPSNATNRTLRWSTSDRNTVSIDSKGKIKAVKQGKAVITVKSWDNKVSAKCTVTVAAAKKFTISWIGGAASTTIEDDNWCQKKIEEHFPNVKFKNKKGDFTGSAQGSQNTQLMLAAGELPDAGYFYYDGNKLYKEGLCRSIPFSVLKTLVPGYAKLLNKYPIGWKMNLVEGKTNEFTYLQGFSENLTMGNYWCSGYRLDWLENLGIKPNGPIEKCDPSAEVYWCKEPFTQDQWETIMNAFTNKDPDRDGKKNTYGVSGNIYKTWTWNAQMGWFGLSEGLNVKDEATGKPIDWYASSQYKNFLKYAASVYKKGWLDKEFPTLDWDKWTEKLAAGKDGYFGSMWLYLNPMYIDRAPFGITDKDPKAKVLMTPLEVGKSGKSGSRAYMSLPWGAGYCFFINKKVDDEKMNVILQVLQYTAFDKDARFWTVFGQEGVDYKWTGEPFKSFPKPTENAAQIKGKSGIGYYNTNFISPADIAVYFNPDFVIKNLSLMEGPWAKNLLFPYVMDPMKKTKFSDINNKVGATVGKVVDEFYYKAVTGEVNVDKDWDGYIKKLNTAGYDQLYEELQKMPLFADIKAGKL